MRLSVLASLAVTGCATKSPSSESLLNSCFSASEQAGWSLAAAPPNAARMIAATGFTDVGANRRYVTHWFSNTNGHYAVCWLLSGGTLPAYCAHTVYEFVPSGDAWGLMPSEIILCDPPVGR